ncbi:MAG: response regulator [Pseudomonadales bacterium]|nr:response regulator [Pseudomonadales bacterium]
MLKLFRRYSHVFLFLPGLVILAMGMLALHTTVKLGSEYEVLNHYYNTLSAHYADLKNTAAEHTMASQIENVITYKRQLYWAVIAMGLTGFLLLIVNADHLQKLVRINREKQDDLKLLSQRLAAIEASFEGIAIVDPEGRLTYMNKALLDVYGVPQEQADEFIGKSWFELYTPENREYIKEYVMPIFEREGFWHDTTKILRLDGKAITAHVSMTRLEDGGFVGTARDVTEAEKMSAEKKQMEHQLSQAQKMEAVGRLAGGIAHDFNNLLVVIKGYLDLAAPFGRADEELGNYLAQIGEAAERAAGLTRQLLSFSRRQIMEARPVDINKLVEGIGNLLQRLLPANIEYQFLPGELSGRVEGDAGQLEQALVNLAVNARDAMPDGGKMTITTAATEVDADYVESHPWARPGSYVVVTVSDSGFGISPEIQSRIFEPFFTTKPEGQGTGLGLSVFFGIVKQHGGFVQLYSEPGHGTEIRMYLPLVEARIVEELPPPDSSESETGRERVLLVEDDPQICRLAERVLTKAGYSVLVAVDGQEAIEKFSRAQAEIDIVLLDVVLPKASGHEVMKHIQEIRPDMPILFTSGYSANGIHTDFILREDLALLQKPYSSEELLRKIRLVIDAVTED